MNNLPVQKAPRTVARIPQVAQKLTVAKKRNRFAIQPTNPFRASYLRQKQAMLNRPKRALPYASGMVSRRII